MFLIGKTDIGNVKKVNQDSMFGRVGAVNHQPIAFATICDGMGGLSNGELASKEAVSMLRDWVETDLPILLKEGITDQEIKASLSLRIRDLDHRMSSYSEKNGACGTTLTAVLLFSGRFACVNIGDSRVYKIHGSSITQETHDQTVVQREVDLGHIKYEDTEHCKGKNVLLQCIGVNHLASPEYSFGFYEPGDNFLLCSDGLRHKLTIHDLGMRFRSDNVKKKAEAEEAAVDAIQYVKDEKERDNISLILIHTED